MTIPQLLEDLIRLLLALAAPAALVALVLAGVALRREGGTTYWIGGSFSRWIFWAVVMLTLPGLVSWFSILGVPTTLYTGTPGGWMGTFAGDVGRFVRELVVNQLAVVTAAFFVLRAVLDLADGGNPLASILTAMFLLAVPSTFSLLQGWNTGTRFATADVLASLWTYVVSRILPIAAGLALIGAICNFWQNKRWMHLVGCAAAFLTTAALWQLVTRMMR